MKKQLLGAFASISLLCFSTGAWADEIVEVFTCTLADGKTMEDAQAVNSKWLAFMRANVDDNISSAAATPVVSSVDGFTWVDTYPDLATWAAGNEALETDEGEAITSGFDDVAECSGNRLMRLEPTE